VNSTLEYALKYAALGLAVFPVKGKIPCTPKGFYDATTDETQIRIWWEQDNPPGIAIATGSQFGIAVLDEDPRNGSADSIESLQRDGVVLPATPLVLTGGGGKHHYFSIPKGVEFKGRSSIRPGIDFKSDGGYCVAPPSRHQSGREYAWELSSGLELPFAPIPEALRLLLVSSQADLQGVAANAKPPTGPLPDVYVEGTRHQFLLSTLGTMRRKNFSQAAALAAIKEENRIKCRPAFTEPEIVALVGDVFKRWQAQENVKIAGILDNAIKIPQDDGLTDMGNANRFVEKFGDIIKFAFAGKNGSWIGFDGRRWDRCAQGAAERAAQTIAVDLHAEAKQLELKAREAAKANLQDDAARFAGRAAAVGGWAKKSESAGKVQAILQLAQSQLEVNDSIFDQKPFLLNFANGTVDLQTGMLLPHNKYDFITMMIGFDYDANARAPYFSDYFMPSIMGGDVSKVDALLRCLGYSLTGSVKEQVMFCCYGPTSSNGKSKLFDCLRGLLGEYACTAPDGLLEEQIMDRHPTQIACLKGKRFVTTVETGAGKRMAENLVKKLTGGDVLSARQMYKDFSDFNPNHKLWIASNNRLKITLDPAIIRRIVEFGFDVHFWDAEKGETGPEHLRQDKEVENKLKSEYQGIAAALVRACMDYQKQGLALPNEVLKNMEDYKTEMDVIGEWIGDCCTVSESICVSSTELFRHFAQWCERNKKGKMSQTAFSLQMKSKGFMNSRGQRNKMFFNGIGLNADNPNGWQEQANDYRREPGSEG
jgi:P4 family phage/plasmid primase-like protien